MITSKSWSPPESGCCLSTKNGTYIFLAYKKTYFTVFQTFDEKLSQQKNILSPNKPTNETENKDLKPQVQIEEVNLSQASHEMDPSPQETLIVSEVVKQEISVQPDDDINNVPSGATDLPQGQPLKTKVDLGMDIFIYGRNCYI